MRIPRSVVGFLAAVAAVASITLIPPGAAAADVTHVRDFLGTWVGHGDDLTLVKISKSGKSITVRVWGSCGDERCYVGEFPAQRFATSVQDGSRGTLALKGQRTPSFATVTYLFTLRDGDLFMQQMYDYNAGDSRQDSYEEFLLHRK